MGSGQDIQFANQGASTAPFYILILGATALRPSQGGHVREESVSSGGSTDYQGNTGHALLPGECASDVRQVKPSGGSIVLLTFWKVLSLGCKLFRSFEVDLLVALMR